jgi:hypothetical protein
MNVVWTADIPGCQHMPNSEQFFDGLQSHNNSFNLLLHIHIISLNSRFEYSVFCSIKCEETWYHLYLLLAFVVSADLNV